MIVDTEGSASARDLIPVIAPDLALIPVGPSPLEAHEAIATSRALEAMSRAWEMPIPHACVFTRLPAAIRTRSMAEAVQGLRDADVRMLETPLIEKEAFRRLFTPEFVSLDSPSTLPAGLDAARTNASRYVENVVWMLQNDWRTPVVPVVVHPVGVPVRF